MSNTDLTEYVYLFNHNKLARILIDHYEHELDFYKEAYFMQSQIIPEIKY